MAVALTAALVLLLVAVIGIIMQVGQNRRLRRQIDDDRQQARNREKEAVARSRAVHVGKISEQLAPLLPGFPYNLKDVQWVGGTIDAIVWDGLEEGREVTVVLLDVKTGRTSAKGRQRKIRDAVNAGRVEFRLFQFQPEQATAVPVLTNVPSELALADEEEPDAEWATPQHDADWEGSAGDHVTFADFPPVT